MRAAPRTTRRLGYGFVATAAFLLLSLTAVQPSLDAQTTREHWVGTWATADVGRTQNPPVPTGGPGPAPFMPNACPVAPAPAVPPVQPPAGQTFAPQPYLHFTNQTLRQIVHTSIGGTRARVVLSNTYGTSSLMIGAASVALRDKDDAIQAGSSRSLTFNGETTVTITPGAVAYSDPVNVTVPQTGDLAIDLYIPGTTNTQSPLTMHGTALQTNYLSDTGNHAGKTTIPVVARTNNWFLLSRVDVTAPDSVGGLVTFGDSITDGTRSTPNLNSRWPDYLARRLATEAGAPKMGIMNAGISGNRVLGDNIFNNPNGVARFDRHALDYSGVTHIVVLLATNDF